MLESLPTLSGVSKVHSRGRPLALLIAQESYVLEAQNSCDLSTIVGLWVDSMGKLRPRRFYDLSTIAGLWVDSMGSVVS